ncbi:MAG: polysaccharide export protein, partial [Acidobacteriaceae bacterium]|nr:polysaccharide export protein [Acidobacteriaceae bacterium]
MNKKLGLWTRIPVRQNLWLLIVVLCTLSCISAAQQQTDSNPLSADQVIRILQSNPELLTEAKTQIQNAARDSGYPVNQSDITDDRVFSKVRFDDQFRLTLSTELKERGYGSQPSEDQTESDRPREKLPVPELNPKNQLPSKDNDNKEGGSGDDGVGPDRQQG